MIVYTLVKVDFTHKQNIGTFTTLEKAQAFQAASEVELFDSGSLAGVGYFIEKVVVQ
jgi:hypothetical protein